MTPHKNKKINVQVARASDGTYIATIAGGWWMARGKTRASAVKAVVKRYRDEQEHLGYRR